MHKLLLLLLLLPSLIQAENIVFPEDSGILDMTKPPYSLVGDGKTDNTAAFQKAFDAQRGKNKTWYFPNGVYLISDSVGIFDGKAHSQDRFINFQGQSEAGSVIRLKNGSAGFGDPKKPKIAVSMYSGRSTGDAMHSYVRNLTVDVGSGNPGATGLRYISNNSGAIYNLTVRSSDPKKLGAIGLDLSQSQNGPAFIKNVTVEGFDQGIEVKNTFSLVFEHIKVSGQNVAGFNNLSGRVSMRGFSSSNLVPAIVNGKNGELTLVEAELKGGAETSAAISSDGNKLFLRDIKVAGYGETVKMGKGEPVKGDIKEWFPGKAYSLFGTEEKGSLRLPIQETPEIAWEENLSKWQKVELGTDTLQAAIDAAVAGGKTTIYFPKASGKEEKYVITKPVRVHGSVNRIIGMENILWIDKKLPVGATVFEIEDLKGPLVIERFFNILENGGWKGLRDRFLIENRSDQPLVLLNFAHGACDLKQLNPGKILFIEDVVTHLKIGKDETCWARQLNPESPDADMVRVDGGTLWLLGLKTEGRATHIAALNGAKVECLGGASYQSWKNQKLDPPMFLVNDSSLSATIGFYSWKQPFTIYVEETQNGMKKQFTRKEVAGFMSLYRSER